MKPLDVAFMKDTPIETQRVYFRLLREAGPERRFAQGMRLSNMVREANLERIRQRHPEYSQADVRREYLREILTPEQFAVFYPENC